MDLRNIFRRRETPDAVIARMERFSRELPPLSDEARERIKGRVDEGIRDERRFERLAR